MAITIIAPAAAAAARQRGKLEICWLGGLWRRRGDWKLGEGQRPARRENSTGRDRQDRAKAWAHVPLWQVPNEEKVEGGALRLSEG